MVTFQLSPEQEALRNLAHEFSETEIKPIAPKHDETEEPAWEVIRKAHELGLMNVHVPPEYGGQGLGNLEGCLIEEELAWGCLGISGSISANNLALEPILLAGTDEQKRKFLPWFCAEPRLAAFALTEATGGSDVAAMYTRARRVGDEYVITGTKTFITNGGVADLYVVFATLDRSLAHKGICAFIVPGDTPGVRAGKKERKMGDRASHVGEVIFEEAVVPAANRLGAEGQGFKLAMQTLDRTRPGIGAAAVGVARRAMEEALAYARERHAFGRPIAEFQMIQAMLADMAMNIDAARLLVWRAAWLQDQGQPGTAEGAMAKCFASDVAMRVTTDAVQILGGNGYMRDYPVEKLMRDAKITQIYEGTNQIQRLVIARQLLKSRS
ncbi:acyl-CoA dehydrogenase family protein [Caldinitratiruptor microaerophilus]|uniref:Acyl-CoA dehydrogenase n=1 Tax=Caldinitratiruptor microaerophilus TaxID=671077 RepID=A0AA35CHD4_9FIRM|nr:acyl-CoA dehydrogenase family protein [Caldinitratiruptor microaerophilus]BDG58980.1 acyl-CoA dehydrogenase [Caldinitratiruptor microaerophilus]